MICYFARLLQGKSMRRKHQDGHCFLAEGGKTLKFFISGLGTSSSFLIPPALREPAQLCEGFGRYKPGSSRSSGRLFRYLWLCMEKQVFIRNRPLGRVAWGESAPTLSSRLSSVLGTDGESVADQLQAKGLSTTERGKSFQGKSSQHIHCHAYIPV